MNKFEKALEENREKYQTHRSRALEQQRKRIKKEQLKNKILVILIATYILLSTILNILLLFSN